MKTTKSFIGTFIIAMLLFFTIDGFAQSTTTGTFKQIDEQHIVWTATSTQFDSAAILWSMGFVLQPGSATFDAQGTINLGTAAAGGTYSTVILLYASYDDGVGFELVDSLGTITSTTMTKIQVDLDDFDQGPQYKLKITNGGAANSFRLGIWRE